MREKKQKNWMKYIGAILLFLLAGSFFTAKPCLAASAEIEITTTSTEVTLGDSIEVYVTVTSDVQSGGVEANLVYDEDILEYRYSSDYVSGNSGFLKISDMNETEAADIRQYVLKFDARKVGVCKISVSGRAMVYDYEFEEDMAVSSTDLSVHVKAAETASENAFLKSLKINPSELIPDFDKKVFEYNVAVGSETQRLIIDAITEDKDATVSISGNDFLKEGENKIIITVFAESGAVIEYTINAFREFAPEDETDEVSENPEEVKSTFSLVNSNGSIFALYEGKYKLDEPGSEVKIPAGYVKSKIIVSDISINAYYPENDMASNFLLIYAINDQNEAGFYQYDKIEKTLQRFVSEGSGGFESPDETDLEEIMQSEEYHKNLNKAALIIAVLSILYIILIAFLIRMYVKSKGRRRRR
ncbi:MAG: hypothetical protein K0S76_11 [Herbinix sp.]|jgi:hypothetical protein|nr:hypothetical protein [Herbinix sp.]